jgi:hypothetical protein
MAGKFETNVQASDIKIESDEVVSIRSHGLLNTFVQSPAHAIAKMTSTVGPVHPENIEVDEHGRIIIRDKAFVAALTLKMATASAADDTNYVCKNAYQCKPALA